MLYKIYDASAGSGKTFTLVKEYLKVILSSSGTQKFRHILALTFTNKAVKEMKERILKNLDAFSSTPISNDERPMFQLLAEDLKISQEELRIRSKKTLKAILHNYAYFDISTIDKFTHRLIRTFAKDLKLPQNFEVVLDKELIRDEAVNRLIDKAGTDKKITKILLDFALEKVESENSWNIAFDLSKIGNLLFEENEIAHIKKTANKELEDFNALKKEMLKKIKTLEEHITKEAEACLVFIDLCGLVYEDFPRQTLPNHFKKIAANEFQPKNLYKNHLEKNLNEGKIVKAGVTIPDPAIIAKILEHYLSIKQNIYTRSFLQNGYNNMRSFTLVNLIQKELTLVLEEQDQLHISSFNKLIAEQVKDQPAPFIYERLGEKYRHYFLDEFQDTSQMQWQNLIPLISNALESEDEQGKKGSLLLVGDAKQAIYSWRGGKAEQFLDLINQIENPFFVSPKPESLPTNYRSRTEIIQFNNAFFKITAAFLGNDTYKNLFLNGSNQKYNTNAGGAVELTFLENNDDATEDELNCGIVLDKVNQARQDGYAFNAICILTRNNKHGVTIAKFLTEHDIEVVSSETLLLRNCPEVLFLIALLAYSSDNASKDTCYQVLQYLIGNSKNTHKELIENLPNTSFYLKERYDFDLTIFQQLSVYDGLEYAIRQFQLAGISDAYITSLLDTVLEVEQKEGTSVPAFLMYWEKKKDTLSIAAPDQPKAVRLMTVHKAKGLEFPVVIFPYANTDIYKDIDAKLWLPVLKEDYLDFEEILINQNKDVVHYSEEAAHLYEAAQQQSELDAFNVLYVALTRAVDRLYVITKKDIDSNGNPKTTKYSGIFIHYLQQIGLWNSEQNTYIFGSLDQKTDATTTGASSNIPYPYSFKDRRSFSILTKSGMLWESGRAQAIEKGNLIHHAMSYIEHASDIKKAIVHFERNGTFSKDELNFVVPKVKQIVTHSELAPYFVPGLLVKNEKDIISKNGLILRPDRVVFYGNKATILDYKTGKENSTYKEQLYQYADAIAEMGYTVEHKILVFINEQVTTVFI